MRFFASGFFQESSSHKPLKITLGSFQIFLKIRWDICQSRCAPGINNTSGKFVCIHLNVNLKKKIYLHVYVCLLYYPKVSKENIETFSDWRFFLFATGVNDGAPWAANINFISVNFQKKIETSQLGYSGAWGKLIHERNLKSMALSL
jgi:hypothetical protein